LKANANSFFIINLLPETSFSLFHLNNSGVGVCTSIFAAHAPLLPLFTEKMYYTQKSGGCPLFDAFGIGITTTEPILTYKRKRCKDLQEDTWERRYERYE
jgi:hypothetical protein